MVPELDNWQKTDRGREGFSKLGAMQGPLLIYNYYSSGGQEELHSKLHDHFSGAVQSVGPLGPTFTHAELGSAMLVLNYPTEDAPAKVFFPWPQSAPPATLHTKDLHAGERLFLESCESVDPDLATLTVEVEMPSPSQVRNDGGDADAFTNTYISGRLLTKDWLAARLRNVEGVAAMETGGGWYLKGVGEGTDLIERGGFIEALVSELFSQPPNGTAWR
jgi:hypothetical protein